MDLGVVKDLTCAARERRDDDRRAALARLCNPTEAELVELAIDGLSDPARNVRGQMVLILAMCSGDRAAEGIVLALRDSTRRVRKLAVRAAQHFIDHAEVRELLEQISEDETEVRKIRERAFHSLHGGQFRARLDESAEAAISFLRDRPALTRFRSSAIAMLASLDPLNEEAEAVLRHVVAEGTKEEAVEATRVLCGFKMIHVGQVPDLKKRRELERTCELARGRTLYWVPRVKAAGTDPGPLPPWVWLDWKQEPP